MAAVVTIDRDQNIAAGFHLYRGSFALDDNYPTGGETLDGTGNLRFDFLVANPEGGYVFQWDLANQKVIVKGVAAHAHDLLIKGGQAAAGTAALAWYATDILGKEAATDKTIAGADSATKGGVIAVAAGVLTEVAAATDLSALTAVEFFAIGA